MPMLRRLTDDEKRGARHWAMEFFIVVAGVLLALWLQQWGERQRALSDMEAAEGAIHDEVRTALESLMWRKAISKCHVDRTQLIQSMLENGDEWPGLTENALAIRHGGPPVLIPSVYTRPLDSFTTAAWTSALATGALAPMDRVRFGKLVAIYDQIETLRRTRDDETDAVSEMSALAFPLHLTPELRAQMTESVYRVDRGRFTFGMISPADFAGSMRGLSWDDTAKMDQWIRENDADAKAEGFVFRDCVAAVENPFRKTSAAAN